MRKSLEVLSLVAFILVTIAVVMGGTYALNGWFAGMAAGTGVWASICTGIVASQLINIVVLLLLFVMIIATLLTLAERKWSAMMQDRLGPNRARIALPGIKHRALGGLPHVAADSLKMLFKEDFIPEGANKILFNLGPILAFAPVFALFAVVPAGPSVNVFGHPVDMVIANPDFGILFVLAIASLAVYGTALAGWSSNNKFALLGGVRATSQMISYEVALGLSLVGAMIAYSTVQLPQMVEAQGAYLWSGMVGGMDVGIQAWGILLQPVGFVLFFAAAFAETKRAPFDVPEGEAEIIGYFLEYSGMKFGMFMISEFVEVVVLSGIVVVVFLGGYHLGSFDQALSSVPFLQANGWLLGAIYGTVFWIKVILLCWVQLSVRWTFPRFRYDQIQALGWKMLLPAGLLNLFVSAALILVDPTLHWLAIVGAVEIAIVVALTLTTKSPVQSVVAAHGHGHDAHGGAAHAAVPAASPSH
jgi:NADH-quinone oxidoreductase subunit H